MDNKKEVKFDSDTALAKIKVLINKYYEEIGRGVNESCLDMGCEIIDNIEDVLSNTKIDRKKIIIETLNIDNKGKYDYLN